MHGFCFRFLCLCTLAISLSAAADEPWASGWNFRPKPMTSRACRLFEDYSFHAQGNPLLKNGVETDGVVVVKDGIVEYERYASAFQRETPHVLWSASKTITYTLVGAAIQEGLIRPTDKLSRFYPPEERVAENSNAFENQYVTVTIQDLVNNGGGFLWNESYESDITESSVLQMLYFAPGFLDTALFAARAPMTAREPDGKWKWVYSSGKSNLLEGVLQRAFRKRDGAGGLAAYDDMPWRYLFTAIGAAPRTGFEQDAAGVYIGSSSAHLTPLDMAKFGKIYLDGGTWNERPIVSKEWAAAASRITDEYQEPGTVIKSTLIEGVAGPAGWWQNKAAKGLDRPYPQAPPDLYAAMGHYGQYIVVIPAKPEVHQGIVMVRTAQDHDPHSVDFNRWVSLGVSCFTDQEPAEQFTAKAKNEKGRGATASDRQRLEDLVSRGLRYVETVKEKSVDLDKLGTNLKEYLRVAKFVVEKALLNRMYAQELCTCRYLTRLTETACRERVEYPFSNQVIQSTFAPAQVSVRGAMPGELEMGLKKIFPALDLTDFNRPHVAVLSEKGDRFGCHLIQ